MFLFSSPIFRLCQIQVQYFLSAYCASWTPSSLPVDNQDHLGLCLLKGTGRLIGCHLSSALAKWSALKISGFCLFNITHNNSLGMPNCYKLSLVFFPQELSFFARYLGDRISKTWWTVGWEGKAFVSLTTSWLAGLMVDLISEISNLGNVIVQGVVQAHSFNFPFLGKFPISWPREAINEEENCSSQIQKIKNREKKKTKKNILFRFD